MRIGSGVHKNREIVVPNGEKVRPTSAKLRESLFNICQSCIEGAHFLDLFAGSGAIGIEALSRGAAKTTFIDEDKDSIHCIKQNLLALKLENQSQVLTGNVFVILEKLVKQGQRFDIIFADPPYDSWLKQGDESISYSQQVLKIVDKSNLLQPGGLLYLEDTLTAQPSEENLQTLTILSSRRLGRSLLLEFQRKKEAVQ